MQVRIYELEKEIAEWVKRTNFTASQIVNMAAQKGWEETVKLLAQHSKPKKP